MAPIRAIHQPPSFVTGKFGDATLHEDLRRLKMPQRARPSKDAAMDKFVAKANIEHYRERLAQETDDSKRQVLTRLLDEEEAKLQSLPDVPQKKRSHDA